MVTSASGARALEGELEHLPLAELVQFFHLQGKDGILAVYDERTHPVAALYYRGHALVHAICRGIEGEEAVYAAFTQRKGRFLFSSGLETSQRVTIRESVQNLVLEGIRRLAGGAWTSALLPGDETALHLAPEPPQDDIRLTAREWSVLSLVNGKRGIRQIVEASGRPRPEVLNVVAGLLAADLVVDSRDDRHLDVIVPRPVRQAEASLVRLPPPTFLANLIVKKADGSRNLRTLMADLGIEESALAEEMRLLVRTRWIAISFGQAEFERWIGAG